MTASRCRHLKKQNGQKNNHVTTLFGCYVKDCTFSIMSYELIITPFFFSSWLLLWTFYHTSKPSTRLCFRLTTLPCPHPMFCVVSLLWSLNAPSRSLMMQWRTVMISGWEKHWGLLIICFKSAVLNELNSDFTELKQFCVFPDYLVINRTSEVWPVC